MLRQIREHTFLLIGGVDRQIINQIVSDLGYLRRGIFGQRRGESASRSWRR
jgi:hypothetical protein